MRSGDPEAWVEEVAVPVTGAMQSWLGTCVPSGSPQRHLGVAGQGRRFRGQMHRSCVTAVSGGQQLGKMKSCSLPLEMDIWGLQVWGWGSITLADVAAGS